MSTNNQWSLDCKRMVRHSCYTMQHTLSMEQNEGTSVYWSDETASGHAVNSCGEGKQIGDAHSGTCSVCVCYAVLCLVTQLYLTLCNPMDCNPPGTSVHGDSPGKNTGVGCHALLQGIFPTLGSNLHFLCLLHCRWTLYLLSHRGSPSYLYINWITLLYTKN